MGKLTPELRARIDKLGTTKLSDAMDALGFCGATCGIRPMIERWRKIVGPAVTMRMTAAGETPQKTHLGMNAIASAKPGAIRVQTSCVASGVTSRGENPVPPVVKINPTPKFESSVNLSTIIFVTSGTIERETTL